MRIKIDEQGYITGMGLGSYEIELVDPDGKVLNTSHRSFFSTGIPVKLYESFKGLKASIKVNGEVIGQLDEVLK